MISTAPRPKLLKIGLTGSIATGKSTIAQMFADQGVAVHDADAAVHAIYGDEGIAPVAALIPSALVEGRIDRQALRAALAADPSLFAPLEAIIHPLVRARADAAAAQAQARGEPMMVFDVPLLFETGGEARMDLVIVVHCAARLQWTRLLARAGMDEAQARLLMDRQMPQAEKIARADFTIATDDGIEPSRQAVKAILTQLRAQNAG
jgi:dephospho-CoA kinase